MAGSRVENIGSIYSRVIGLLRSGAVKEADTPLWLSVYERFPPKDEPVSRRPVPEKHVRNILYKEDIVRAKFYDTFGRIGIVDMTDHNQKVMSERFIERYNELEKSSESEDLFNSTIQSLKAEGYTLKTLDEIEKERLDKREARLKELAQKQTETVTATEAAPVKPLTASELFGKRVVQEEDEDY